MARAYPVQKDLAETTRLVKLPSMAIGPSFGGFVYFAGAKFLGYSAFVHFLRKKWNDLSTEMLWRTFGIGGIRTLIGVGVGISYGLLFSGIVSVVPTQFRCN